MARTSPTPTAEHNNTNHPILHTPDGEDLAPEAGNAASGASVAASHLRSPQAAAGTQKTGTWFDGVISSIMKPKQLEHPPPPPYPPPEVESSSLLRDSAAAANAAEEVHSGRGGQDGSSSGGAPYVEYEQDSEGEDHTADAVALEALIARIEAQVERRLKSKMEESFSSAILALQQDLASMASTAAAKEKAAEEKIAALQAELERQSWASEGFCFPDQSDWRLRLPTNATKTFSEPMT